MSKGKYRGKYKDGQYSASVRGGKESDELMNYHRTWLMRFSGCTLVGNCKNLTGEVDDKRWHEEA